ncbi:MAG: hypothetical protein P1P90_06390 [Patescibacteria group bacterium]|nr:hypothetical protein [Patescibacteria group bacterium]
MTEEKPGTDQVTDDEQLDAKRSAEIPAESAEMARAFWSSLQEDCRKRAQANAKTVANEALAVIHKITECASESVRESAETADRLSIHGVILYPANKT